MFTTTVFTKCEGEFVGSLSRGKESPGPALATTVCFDGILCNPEISMSMLWIALLTLIITGVMLTSTHMCMQAIT